MAAVDVDICNLALGIIGDRRIQSMSEKSTEAAECSRFYEQARDEALESFDWPFARSFAAGVAPAGIALMPGFAYAYVVPPDCIAVRGIARDLTSEADPEFMISAISASGAIPTRILFTNKSGSVIVYTKREAHVPNFSPLFVSAVAARLAFYLAMPLTKSTDKRDKALALYKEAVEMAAVSADNQGRAALSADVSPDWVGVRG